ncbi:hypothetical protein ACDQ55_21250 [Chitinophaga sp. 30R24]|uniref:hypothetical protein n=1 Tax=Chitinophaga sp. 30R24 TaxID=3248838 RepID=UPI003B9124C3
MKVIFFIALALLGPIKHCFVQDLILTPVGNQSLMVGDTVFDIVFFNAINYPLGPTARPNDFTRELVILDFRATWYMASIPKQDTLQQQLKDKVAFILVNSITGTLDSSCKVDAFFNHATTFRLITIIENRAARKLFHIYFSHYVGISPGRTILAITNEEAITKRSIQVALHDNRIGIPKKIDRQG